MLTAALILGIIGGIWGAIFGIIIAAVGSFIGGVSGLFDAPSGGGTTALGVAVLILSICGIVGGGVSKGNAKPGGILLLVGSVGMIILTVWEPSWATIVPMLLLITGGVLALVANRKAIAV